MKEVSSQLSCFNLKLIYLESQGYAACSHRGALLARLLARPNWLGGAIVLNEKILVLVYLFKLVAHR
jgi:hypothetical protein